MIQIYLNKKGSVIRLQYEIAVNLYSQFNEAEVFHPMATRIPNIFVLNLVGYGMCVLCT